MSHRRPKQLRDIYRKVLIDSARFFTGQNPLFQLFNSQRFQSNDLLFSDSTVDFNLLDDRTSFSNYLGRIALPSVTHIHSLSLFFLSGSEYLAMLSRLYECPLRVLRWCVISVYEKEKCRLMKNAFARKNIKPDIDCISAKNGMECMSKIRQGIADIITVDAADAYRGQRYYQLVPLAAEDYGVDMESNVMYAVAVAKRTDLTSNRKRIHVHFV